MRPLELPQPHESHLWVYRQQAPGETRKCARSLEKQAAQRGLQIIIDSYQSSAFESSLSHSWQWGVWAISQASKIGVDIEPIKERSQLSRIVARQLGRRTRTSPNWSLQTCLRLWTFSEAYFKWSQQRLHLDQIDSGLWQQLSSKKNFIETEKFNIHFFSLDYGQFQGCICSHIGLRHFQRINRLLLSLPLPKLPQQ